MHAYTGLHICVCVYKYIYIYIYTHTFLFTCISVSPMLVSQKGLTQATSAIGLMLISEYPRSHMYE